MVSRLLLGLMLTSSMVSAAMAGGAGMQSPSVKNALELVRQNARSVSLSANDRFSAKDVVIDEKGGQHVRFVRYFKGLPVIGGDVVVHADAQGRFVGSSLTMKQPLALSVAPRITEDLAVLTAQRSFVGMQTGEPVSTLAVYARGDRPVLAYDVMIDGELDNGGPSQKHILVSADDGRVLDQWDDIQNAAAAATGRTQYSGDVGMTADLAGGVYSLLDPSRGNNYTTDLFNSKSKRSTGTIFTSSTGIFGDNTTANRATAGADAQYGEQVTWDFYKNSFGRNGIANDGAGAVSRVHYSTNYANAFWSDSCFCMTYGDGDGKTFSTMTALDVAGHEMTHGVTSRTAALIYSGESGGLNEATSDIMGTMVEYYANNANDQGDYKIGEKLYINNPGEATALRYMYKPSLDGKSPDCWSSTVGSLDVHYSSGIGNRAYYFIAEGSTDLSGATCNNSTVTGVGRQKAAAIWYKALTVYMTSNTNYAGARTATLNAASDLYGTGSPEYNSVAAAWSAVNVN